jgi:hypothetical protein
VFLIVGFFFFCYKALIMPILFWLDLQKEKAKAQQEEEEDAGGDAEYQAAIAEDFSADILKELKISFLKTLYIRAQKEFELFRTMVNAISYDQEKLSDDEAKHFKKRLKQRIRAIEDTVDLHLNLIGGLETYMEQSYMYKLLLLELNELKIKAKDPKVIRCVDVT